MRKLNIWPILGLAAGLVLAAAGAWLYLSGRYFELLRPKAFGKLRVELRYGSGETPGLLPVSARLVPLGLDRGAAGPGGAAGLAAAAGSAEGRSLRIPGRLFELKALFAPAAEGVVVSDRIYLRPGDYLLQMKVGEKQFSQAFYLPSYRSQESAGLAEGLRLTFSYEGHRPEPLALYVRAFDELTGRELGSLAATSVYASFGLWLDLANLPPSELMTGRSYLLRVSAPGYQTETLSVPVGITQTEAHVALSLLPLPGRLSIVSGLSGIKLRLDGLASAPTGDRSRRPQPLVLVESRPLSLSLLPGAHRLEARAGARKGEAQLVIEPGRERTIIVEAGAEPGFLAIKNLE